MRPFLPLLIASLLSSSCHSFLGAGPFRRIDANLSSNSPFLCRRAFTPPSLHAEEVTCDVLVVGGGPAGCTAALYTSRAALSTVVIDKNPAVGALAITSHIANYPGIDKTVSGAELLDMMRDQAVQYGTVYKRAQVFIVDTEGEQKTVYTPDATYKTRALILATGAMGRKPSIPGEGEYLGSGVSYCATCDGAFYEGSEVAVVGVTQEAIEEALFLTKFASTVHWVTPTEPDMENEFTKNLLECGNVKRWEKHQIVEVEGEGGGVTGVQLREGPKGSPFPLPVEGVFIYVAGSKPITDFLSSDAVAFNEDGGVSVDDEMRTSVDGVWAIGDIRNTPFKQVVVAASDGCIAAMSIDRYLKGRKKIKVDWVHE